MLVFEGKYTTFSIGSDDAWTGISSSVMILAPGGVAGLHAVGSPSLIPGPVTLSPSGIAGPHAVGTPSLGGLISPAGIGSRAAVGNPALLFSARAFALYIANIDRTANLMANTLDVSMGLNERSSARMTLHDIAAGAYMPEPGQPVVFYWGTEKRFAGLLQEITAQNEGGTDIFWYPVTATGWDAILDRRRITKTYDQTYGTINAILQDMVNNILGAEGMSLGTVSSSIAMATGDRFQWIGRSIKEAFDELSKYFQVDIKVDWDKRIHAHDFTTTPAPYNLTDDDGNMLHNTPEVIKSMGDYANRIVIRSSSGISPLWCDLFTDTRSPKYHNTLNGADRFFVTTFYIKTPPRVKVDGVEQPIAELSDIGTVSGWKWYWIENGFGVMQRMSDPPLSTIQELEVCYQADIGNLLFIQDDAEIAARAVIEGGSGIHEAVLDVPDLPSYESAIALAEGVLARRGSVQTQVAWDSRTQGTEPGQSMNINLLKPIVASGGFVLDRVSFSEWKNSMRDSEAPFLRYKNHAVTARAIGGWQEYYERQVALMGKTKTLAIEMVVVHLQDGLVAAVATGTNVGKNPGEWKSDVILKEASVSIDDTEDAPDGDVTFDLVMSGVSVFGTTKLVLPAGKRAASQSFFSADTVYAAKGEKVRTDVSGTITVGGPATVTLVGLRR